MPDSGFSILFKGINFLRLLKGLWVTLQISLVSVGLSFVFGTMFGILMTVKNRFVQAFCWLYLNFIRIMPQLVLLFLVYFGVTRQWNINLSSWTSAVVVFTLWGTAEMGDLVRGALTSIPIHQYESAAALGLDRKQTFRHVILPQTIRRLVAPSINLITRMIKTTSLVEIIGMVEVLKTGQQIIDANRMQYPTGALWVYGAVFILYFLLCWPISVLAGKLEQHWRQI
ncbi:MAG: amino acid ABC transporter permease [Solobacterium sp.]|nr:amino acid ABC transporter permease [Solobacterium sp.]